MIFEMKISSVRRCIALASTAMAMTGIISIYDLEPACAEEPTSKYTVQYGFIDKEDNFKIAPRFGACGDFLDGLALVRLLHNDGPPVAGIDKNGKSLFVVPERGMMSQKGFADDVAYFRRTEMAPMEQSWLVNRVLSKNGQKVHQVIDTSGRLIWQNPPSETESKSVDMSALKSAEQKRLEENKVDEAKSKFLKNCEGYGIHLLTPTERPIVSDHARTPPKRWFSEGLVCIDVTDVDHHARQFFIDENGTLKFELSDAFFAVGSFHEGLAPVLTRVFEQDNAGDYVNARLGFINKSGKPVIECKYRTHYSSLDDIGFSEGLATVQDQDLFGVIDKSGRTIIPFKYNWMSGFHDGLCLTCVLVDSAGKIFDARNDDLGYQTKASFIQAYAKALEKGLQTFPDNGVVRFDISETYEHPVIYTMIKGSGNEKLDEKLRKMVSEIKPPRRGQFMSYGGSMPFVLSHKHVSVAFSPQDPQYLLLEERCRLSRQIYDLPKTSDENKKKIEALTAIIGDARLVGVLGHSIDTVR